MSLKICRVFHTTLSVVQQKQKNGPLTKRNPQSTKIKTNSKHFMHKKKKDDNLKKQVTIDKLLTFKNLMIVSLLFLNICEVEAGNEGSFTCEDFTATLSDNEDGWRINNYPDITCTWFGEDKNRCSQKSDEDYLGENINANEACCVCGGGIITLKKGNRTYKYESSNKIYREANVIYVGSTQENGEDKKVAIKKTKSKKEVEILEKLHSNHFEDKKKGHAHIAKFIDVITHEENQYIVMEYYTSDLIEHLNKFIQELEEMDEIYMKNETIENNAKGYMMQILKGVSYMHGMGISHLDLKLDNILVDGNSRTKILKIADFETAHDQKDGINSYINEKGSPSYKQPKIDKKSIKKNSGEEADVWSLGVIMFGLVYNKSPVELVKKHPDFFKTFHVRYPFEKSGRVSEAAYNLIKEMLHPIPEKRITLKQILLDEWFAIG